MDGGDFVFFFHFMPYINHIYSPGVMVGTTHTYSGFELHFKGGVFSWF